MNKYTGRIFRMWSCTCGRSVITKSCGGADGTGILSGVECSAEIRGDCDVRTWLCSMARNAYLSHLRKERPSQPIDELEISDPKQAVEEQIMDAQQAMAVHRCYTTCRNPIRRFSPCGSSGSFPLVTSEACSDARQTGPV